MKNLLFICFAFVFLLLACSEEKKIPKYDSKFIKEAEEQPDQISYDFEAIFVDSSFTKAKLSAINARIYNRRKETWLDSNVRVQFFSQNSANSSILTCDTVRIDDLTKNMLARGRVLVVSDSTGTTLQTSVLQWDDKQKKLFSTEFVIINSPFEKIEGYGFESDQYLDNYIIYKVTGVQK